MPSKVRICAKVGLSMKRCPLKFYEPTKSQDSDSIHRKNSHQKNIPKTYSSAFESDTALHRRPNQG